MKTALFITTSVLSIFLLAGCEKEMDDISEPQPVPGEESPSEEIPTDIPDGYFVVSFSPGQSGNTRAAVTGSDGRVRHLRYIIYNSAGDYVKEKIILQTSNPIPTWPLAAVRDTLPKGSYTAVF